VEIELPLLFKIGGTDKQSGGFEFFPID